MRSTLQTTVRAALLALLASTLLLAAGCSIPVADAQGGYPYPVATTAVPAGPTATTAPAGPTATTAPAGPTATTAPAGPTATSAPVAPTRAPAVPTATRPPLPQASEGSTPLFIGAALLLLAGAVALARRRA